MPHHLDTQKQQLKFIVPGNEIAVRNALVDTIATLRMLDLADEEYGAIELVLAEVMNNIVEHAYANIPDGIINLEIVARENGLYCKLIDEGHKMPDGQVPLGELASTDCDLSDLPEGGFGWFLIKDLTRDLEYTRQDGKNLLTFRIAIGPPLKPAN